jgi:hypothetical protein
MALLGGRSAGAAPARALKGFSDEALRAAIGSLLLHGIGIRVISY